MNLRNEKILEIVSMPALFLLIFGGAFFYLGLYDRAYQANEPKKIFTEIAKQPEVKNVVLPIENSEIYTDIDVPFITQAPFRQWGVYPFNHTCEEASVLMINYYLSGHSVVDENITKQELLSMVDFENSKYGFSDDTNTEQTAQFIRDYYGYSVSVVYDISENDIKKELENGNPVIVPTAGRLLKNPYFTAPGPLFHMLVIKGYNSSGFITNDPGLYSKGVDYVYSFDVMMNAIHDFDFVNPENSQGRKAMIIVERY